MNKSLRQQRHIHPTPFVVEPEQEHTHTFILLHGLGSNGEKFGTELLATGRTTKGLNLAQLFPGARFIFPTAKACRSTALRRTVLTQWFDIASLDDFTFKQHTQAEGLADSAKHILSILRTELESIPAEHVIIGGLSMGCAMSLSLLFCLEHPLGAFIGMSGWLPYQKDLEELLRVESREGEPELFESNGEDGVLENPALEAIKFERELLDLATKDADMGKCSLSTPVFYGHGEADEKVELASGEGLVRVANLLGMDVTAKKYPGQGHWYKVPEEIDDIFEFLEAKAKWQAGNIGEN